MRDKAYFNLYPFNFNLNIPKPGAIFYRRCQAVTIRSSMYRVCLSGLNI